MSTIQFLARSVLKVFGNPEVGGGWAPLAPGPARAAIADAEAVLFDWDGCVALGNRPLPEALELLLQCSPRAAIVSNNSSNLPEDFAAILAEAGVAMPASRIFLAGVEAIERAAELGAERALVLGDGRMRAYARKLGLNLVREEADMVVLLRDTRFSYARLCCAANSVRQGATLIVANPDLTHPGPQGRLTPETGALLAALTACLQPARPPMEMIGKPGPRLFQRALEAIGAKADGAVMIGDNPATDIAGAEALGMRGVLIGPGSGLELADLADPEAERPSLRRGRVRTS